jgi:hypothetical protein
MRTNRPAAPRLCLPSASLPNSQGWCSCNRLWIVHPVSAGHARALSSRHFCKYMHAFGREHDRLRCRPAWGLTCLYTCMRAYMRAFIVLSV